ncbi:MAG TPA: YihY/virulence factor BrkB family protein [Burkholderiales bacterium]|nr:YihY/virulence factor BrkB family protein [Burkholderiales bacterium]
MARTADPADAQWERGRGAESPKDIPKRGWRDILMRVKRQMSEDRLSIVAAGVAFYALLAVFPALIALVALYGLAFDPKQVSEQVAALSGMLPPQAADILLGQLQSLTSTQGAALGLGAIGGLVLALWSASAGVRTLMEALNVAYDEEESRGFVSYYGTALLLTLGAIVGAIVAIGVVVALPVVVGFLGLGSFVENMIAYARWPILAISMIVGLAVIYRYGPSREEPRWSWTSPGALVATLLWVAGSALFSLYVTRFGNYNETYGSMGAVVILLTWFLLGAYAILIGAEINSEMERQTRKDTTTGKPKALGRRRAHAADTVGKMP